MRFYVIGFQTLIFSERGSALAVEIENVIMHLVIREGERLVVIQYRLRSVDLIEFDKSTFEKPDAKLADLICSPLCAIQNRQGESQIVFLTEAIEMRDIDGSSKVEKRIVVVLEKLVSAASRPGVYVNFGKHASLPNAPQRERPRAAIGKTSR